jgi:hypothetical protein
MKVTAHVSSYESGFVQFCEHYDSIREATIAFAKMFGSDGPLSDTATDCVMSVYPYTPEDNSQMSHSDNLMFQLVRGPRGGIRKWGA